MSYSEKKITYCRNFAKHGEVRNCVPTVLFKTNSKTFILAYSRLVRSVHYNEHLKHKKREYTIFLKNSGRGGGGVEKSKNAVSSFIDDSFLKKYYLISIRHPVEFKVEFKRRI